MYLVRLVYLMHTDEYYCTWIHNNTVCSVINLEILFSYDNCLTGYYFILEKQYHLIRTDTAVKRIIKETHS